MFDSSLLEKVAYAMMLTSNLSKPLSETENVARRTASRGAIDNQLHGMV